MTYKVDDVLHPLFEAGHAQFPHFELYRFLLEHLAGQAHGGLGVLTLGWFLQKILMEIPQVRGRQRGCVGTLSEMDDVLCHVVETNEIVIAIVALSRCRESEVEGGLEEIKCYGLHFPRWLTLASCLTYALHVTKHTQEIPDDGLGLQP